MKFNQYIKEQTAEQKKIKISKEGIVGTMWQLEDKLKKQGFLNDNVSLAFFCPVYFAGQVIVKQLLEKKDEHGEVILFPLPSIKNHQRIQIGLEQMRILGIENPEKLLKKLDGGAVALRCFSTLPGIEGIVSGKVYEYIAWEAVQLAAFQIVPNKWLNAGDPYNQSYRFPGEDGFSPYWRIPPWKEFQKMRPDLAKSFKETPQGIVKTDFSGM